MSSWVSPNRKISFKYRVDAVEFEKLRIKFVTDEVQAWIEYTRQRSAKKMDRRVLDEKAYDHVRGSSREFSIS